MHRTQPRPLPERIYEPNIIHNPLEWMGIWTPHGWRVHRMRAGRAERLCVTLNGDGKTTFFPEALLDPATHRVEWQDDLHLRDDPFTDGGIYPSDPRVEYPPGRQRWAVSHTLLAYPFADHTLYTHEYTWDMLHGHLQTHFHHHVALEEAHTDAGDGRTVQVQHRPISRSVEGNVTYPLPNSAVRGVWTSPDKSGLNLYTRRVTQLIAMHNGVYAIAPRTPVVQCYGVWPVLPDDPVGDLFDSQTGMCTDAQRLIEQLHVPLDEPKLAMTEMPIRQVASQVYGRTIGMLAEPEGTVDEAQLARLRARLAARFAPGEVGFAGKRGSPTDNLLHCHTYCPAFDYNEDGTIDAADEERLARHLGRRVRYNLYFDAYFGGDWLSTSLCMDPDHRPGMPAIADYMYGAGYDAQTGIIRLLETPGPNKPVWVEYHYDAPAVPGEGNIVVHLFRER